ncbi:AAA family ATPase [Mycobacterium sp. GA-1199]|uniref:AAA family ATPase n=1 Tax=Mycobacterium sp. GA-1199 TaxID=1772287 RepID=UPI000A4547F1|nr:AAA family ATPase [Mycobacterium sp. GA-1199]
MSADENAPPITDASDTADTDRGSWSFVDGAAFILDVPDSLPALWGQGNQVLWAEGESLMISGPLGTGKTTLAGLLVQALLLPVPGPVLGLPVHGNGARVLYLAMDRPAQIARSLHRQFGQGMRATLAERLMVWKGPPPDDLAANPALLTTLAEQVDADIVFLDSLKDAAIGLSEDAVGAGYNRARQILLQSGRQLAELHHPVKRTTGGVKDVYGSTWLTSGAGSVVLLDGNPGDTVVSFRHVRQPAEEVGPFLVHHDQASGLMVIHDQFDLLETLKAAADDGLSAEEVMGLRHVGERFDKRARACAMQKARRDLDRLVEGGRARREDGTQGGVGGGTPARWFAT